MKQITAVVIFGLMIAFLSCSGNAETNSTNQQDSTENSKLKKEVVDDKTSNNDYQKMSVVIDGKTLNLVYHEDNEKWVRKSIEVSKRKNPFKKHKLVMMDVTNDGIKDSLVFDLFKHDTFAFEQSFKIYDRGRLILNDVIIYGKGWIDDISWGKDSAFYHLLPYSLIAMSEFEDDINTYVDNSGQDGLEKDPIIEYLVKDYAKKTSDNPAAKAEEIFKYLQEYSGIIIQTMEVGTYHGNLQAWYAPDSAFITIFEP